jgi:hypothetical protein
MDDHVKSIACDNGSDELTISDPDGHGDSVTRVAHPRVWAV